jgi:hypothetical protein
MIIKRKIKRRESEGIPRKHRIGIDIDNKNQFELLKRYFNCRNIFNKVIVLESLKGYHIHVMLKDRTPETNLHIRDIINDCEGRMSLDYGRYIEGEHDIMETMFFDKRVGKEKGGETLINPLRMEWWMIKE